jgi:hypothetical protein
MTDRWWLIFLMTMGLSMRKPITGLILPTNKKYLDYSILGKNVFSKT